MNKQVLIIYSTNDPPHHFYEDYAEALKVFLGDEGYVLVAEESLEFVKQESRLSEFDVIIFCGRYGERDDAAEKGLESFVHAGKGLVVIHIASSSFEFSPRWRKLVGRVWEYGGPPPFTSSHPEPPGQFSVNIIKHHHAITKGLTDFVVIRDERYQNLLVAPNAEIQDLAYATIQGRTEPMAWVLTPPEGGRVFHITLGHELSTYENKGFQELLKRGVTWAGGDLV